MEKETEEDTHTHTHTQERYSVYIDLKNRYR